MSDLSSFSEAGLHTVALGVMHSFLWVLRTTQNEKEALRKQNEDCLANHPRIVSKKTSLSIRDASFRMLTTEFVSLQMWLLLLLLF